MDNKVLEIRRACPTDARRACPTDARRAIFDFALLSILIQLFLAFVYPDKIYYYLYLTLPHLVIAISSKFKQDFVYLFGIALAFTSILIGIFQGIYLVSLKEWGIFFKLGYSLHFSELSDFLLFLNLTGIIYFSMRGIILKRGLSKR